MKTTPRKVEIRATQEVTSQTYDSPVNMAYAKRIATSDNPTSTVTEKRKSFGNEFAVAECSLRNSDGVTVHKFPRDPSLTRQ